MNSIIQEETKPQNIKLSKKSKNLKLNPDDFWEETTSPIFHRIVKKFYDLVECDSNKLQEGSQQSDANDAIRRLVYDGILHQMTLKNGRSSKRKRDKKYFFTLTIYGIKILIDGLPKNPEKINSEFFKYFWDILSITFKKNNITDFRVLETLCDYYETKILKINREYVVPLFFNDALEKFKNLESESFWNEKYSEELYSEYKILTIIFNRKAIFIPKSTIQKLEDKKLAHKTLEKYLKKYLDLGIIIKSNDQRIEKYGLTFLGLIKLFYHLYSDYLQAQRDNDIEKIKKTNESFETIRKKYSFLLPMILEDKHYENLKLTPFNFLKFFVYLYFDEILSSLRLILYLHPDNFGFNNLVKFDNIRGIDFRHKIERHLDSFTHMDRYLDTVKTVLNNKTPRKQIQSQINEVNVRFPQDIVSLKHTIDSYWLDFPDGISKDDFSFSIPNLKNFNLNGFFPQPKSYDQSIKRKITFDFYSVYASIVGGLEYSHVSKQIKQWYSDQVDELSNWLSNYSKRN